MSKEEKEKKLEELYSKVVEDKQYGLALDILDRLITLTKE